MVWSRNKEYEEKVKSLHGKYVLLTDLKENNEKDIWKIYNVIRTVEEPFHVLKTDLDIRPVYHKSDIGDFSFPRIKLMHNCRGFPHSASPEMEATAQ